MMVRRDMMILTPSVRHRAARLRKRDTRVAVIERCAFAVGRVVGEHIVAVRDGVALILNASSGGMLLCLSHAPARGELLTLSMPRGLASDECLRQADVRWTRAVVPTGRRKIYLAGVRLRARIDLLGNAPRLAGKGKADTGTCGFSKHEPVRLLVVDDLPLIRLGLRRMFERTGWIQVVGEAGSGTEAVTEAIRLKPTIVLMDVRLPDGSGVEACRKIRAACPDMRVIFLSAFADPDALSALFVSQADGYVVKDMNTGTLIRAIKDVENGHIVLDHDITQRVLARRSTV